MRALPQPAALAQLQTQHDLDGQAAQNLVAYLREQAARGTVPDDETLAVERLRDELGDWRVCVLSPLGGQILAPWSMAVVARIKAQLDLDAESMWTNDGFVIRLPGTAEPPALDLLLPPAADVEALVTAQLGGTALFAAKFRESAARALLLPRRRPGGRTPLWLQRKRAHDLLAVASRHAQFPILLESYRECLRDVFDMPALVATLQRVERGTLRVVVTDGQPPSPFAASLLFGFVANYLYDGDAPLAERRAQALSIDHAQLAELLGETELRRLLDEAAITEVVAALQQTGERARVRSADGVHDLLLRLGDLTGAEIAARAAVPVDEFLQLLARAKRIVALPGAHEPRWVAVEEAARYRDALGVPLPPGLPPSLLEQSERPLDHLLLRYARTHGPFTAAEPAERYGLPATVIAQTLHSLVSQKRILTGEFLPAGSSREFVDAEVLAQIRRRSLTRLRREVEPVAPEVLQRALLRWQGVTPKRRGLDALLDVVAQLQGAPLLASSFERTVLRARVDDYKPSDLDALAAAGEVVWCGLEPVGDHDGRIALFLADDFARLYRLPEASQLDGLERAIFTALQSRGASFFSELPPGFPPEVLAALWSLVWRGLVTNDTFAALRARARPAAKASGRDRRSAVLAARERSFRSRRDSPPAGDGRWSVVATRGTAVSDTERSAAVAQQLLGRYGILTRAVAGSEPVLVRGGFTAIYDVLKALEESGRIRRGYFATGVGALQFAQPGALELLRTQREPSPTPEAVTLAATDPALLYGGMLPWPATTGTQSKLVRAGGAEVVLVDGALVAYIARGGRSLTTFLPAGTDTHAAAVARATAAAIFAVAVRRSSDGLVIGEIDGLPSPHHVLAPLLAEAGFTPSAQGYYLRRPV